MTLIYLGLNRYSQISELLIQLLGTLLLLLLGGRQSHEGLELFDSLIIAHSFYLVLVACYLLIHCLGLYEAVHGINPFAHFHQVCSLHAQNVCLHFKLSEAIEASFRHFEEL